MFVMRILAAISLAAALYTTMDADEPKKKRRLGKAPAAAAQVAPEAAPAAKAARPRPGAKAEAPAPPPPTPPWLRQQTPDGKRFAEEIGAWKAQHPHLQDTDAPKPE